MLRQVIIQLVSGALLYALPMSAQAAGLGGTLESVSPETQKLVLKVVSTNKTYELRVDDKTTITFNGKPIKLADLVVGTRVAILTDDADLALKIAARSGDAPSAPPVAARPPATPKPSAKPGKSGANPNTPGAPPTSPLDIPATPATPGIGTAAGAAAGQHYWPQFGGPKRNNVSSETGLLKSWPAAGPKLLWKAPGLGAGYSGVAVAGGQVITMGNQGASEAVLAMDLQTGKPLWGTPTGSAFTAGGQGNGPRGTPTVDGDLIYALGANGDLACLELVGGKLRWHMNILQQFGGHNISWGISESVLIDGDKLICTPGARGATMVALDKHTGKPIWRATSPGNEEAAYSSVIAADVGGVRQYVQLTSRATIGIRATDGAFMWEDTLAANDSANCSTPVFGGGAVFTSSGYGTGGSLVMLASQRGATIAKPVYQTKQMLSHHGGMVLLDGYLYGSSDPGVLRCLEFATGRMMWQNRSGNKGSITIADRHIYLRSEVGDVSLVAATPEGFSETGRFIPPEPSGAHTWSYPVVADGKLFLRDMDVLQCYDVKEK